MKFCHSRPSIIKTFQLEHANITSWWKWNRNKKKNLPKTHEVKICKLFAETKPISVVVTFFFAHFGNKKVHSCSRHTCVRPE